MVGSDNGHRPEFGISVRISYEDEWFGGMLKISLEGILCIQFVTGENYNVLG